jgi:hypothetical protein
VGKRDEERAAREREG